MLGEPGALLAEAAPANPTGNSGNSGNSVDSIEETRSRSTENAVGTSGTPRGFDLKKGGIWFADEAGDPIWICSALEVAALARDAAGQAWGRLLRFRDPDGREHEWAAPAAMLAGDGAEFRATLLGLGLDIAPGARARALLAMYVLASRPQARARCTDRAGWHGEAFVLPDSVIGNPDERLVFQSAASPPALAVAGSLDGWRDEVAALAVGNSRLVLAISMAFAAPLLDPVGDLGGGINFVGPSSSGKTTALRLAASVWDAPSPLRTWRATTNGLEGAAAVHNDRLLILDELGEIDPREAGAAAYLLANGCGKSRARRDGLSRPAATWRLLFLSSGEVGLSAHMGAAGQRSRAGQEIRLIDIDADAGAGHGLFECLHGSADGGAFAGRLADAVSRHHGHAARGFVERLVGIDREKLRARIAEMRKDFARDLLPPDADGQARRVADRLALIAAGGGMATRFGLTGWPDGEAVEAAKRCFKDWLDRRGAGPQEDREAIATVNHFLELHGASRFQRFDERDGRMILNRAGFLKEVPGEARQFLFFPQTFRRDVCGGLDHRLVLRALDRAGRLKHDADRLTLKVRGIGNVYAVTESGNHEE